MDLNIDIDPVDPTSGTPTNDMDDMLSSWDLGDDVEDEKKKKKKPKGDTKKKKKISRAEILKYEKFYDIQKEHLKRREKDLEMLKAKRERKMKKRCTFKPQIQSKTESEARSGELHKHLLNWGEQKKKNIESLREMVERKKRCTFKPEVSPKSISLLRNQREGKEKYENPVNGWKKRVKNFQANRKSPKVDLKNFSPRLSRGTKNMTRGRSDVPFHVRLYVDEFAMAHHKKTYLARKAEEIHTEKPKKPIKKVTKKRQIEHSHLLYDESIRRRNNQLQRKQEEERKIKEKCTHHPKISSVSREIAKISNRRKPLYYLKNKNKNKKGSEGSKITRTKKKKNQNQNNIHHHQFYEGKMFTKSKREQYLEILRKRKEAKELESCSFMPQTNRKVNAAKLSKKGYSFDYGLQKNERKEKKRQEVLFSANVRKYLEQGRRLDDEEIEKIIEKKLKSGVLEQEQERVKNKNKEQKGEENIDIIEQEEEEKREDNNSKSDDEDDDEEEEEVDRREIKKLEVVRLQNDEKVEEQEQEEQDDEDDEDDEVVTQKMKEKFEEMGEIEEEIDTAFDDWERLSSSFDM